MALRRFYDWQGDPDDLAGFLNPRNWPGRYWAVHDERGALVGFFQFERDGGTIEVGLGLRPDLTGRGLGAAFVQAGLDFARRHYAPERFTLRVATFNRRAIRAYERADFVSGRVFTQATNGGLYEFVEMSRPA
ncbi:MAG TPA: GNAT family N-acetyltransferase [Thermomicrobiales bacterium]|nr:GNAT family N-acetyltransferase [Thermomicrobiales bacterium]